MLGMMELDKGSVINMLEKNGGRIIMKDIDSAVASLYLRIFCWILFPSLFTSAAFAYGMNSVMPLLAGFLISIIFPVPIILLLNQTSNFFVSIYSGGRRPASPQELMEGELTRVKHFKAQGRFSDALEAVNRILEHMPEHPQPLFLKAQILSAGFSNHAAAKVCLEKIVRMESVPDETIRQWANGLLEEISKQHHL